MSIRLEILAPFNSFSRKKAHLHSRLTDESEAYNLFFGENIYHIHGLHITNGVEDSRYSIWSMC